MGDLLLPNGRLEQTQGKRGERGERTAKEQSRALNSPTCEQMSCRGRGEGGAPRLSVK